MNDRNIPKKPIKYITPNDVKVGCVMWSAGVTVRKCAVCGQILNRSFGYCPVCGQKIDWSGEYEK